MKKWLLTLMLGIMLVFTAAPAGADPPPVPQTDMGIIPASRVSVPGYTPRYERYSVGAYQWDQQYGMLEWGPKTWNDMANLLMLLNAIIVKWAVRALEWAFTVPIVNDLVVYVGQITKALASVLMTNWILQLGIAFAGVAAIWYGVVQRRMSEALGVLLNVMIVLVVGFASLNGVLEWALTSVNDSSTAIAGEILNGVGKLAAPGAPAGGNAFVSGSEAIWDVFVVTPWATGEFDGNLATAWRYAEDGVPGGQFLAKNNKERSRAYDAEPKAIQETSFAFWQQGLNAIKRVAIAFFALVVGFAGAALIFCLSGAVIAFSVLAVLILPAVVLLVVVSLFSPQNGVHWLRLWVLKWLGYLVSKIAIAALLSVVIVFCMVLGQMGATYGWGFSAFLQLILVVAVVYGINRIGFKNAVGAIAGMPSNPQRAFMQLQQRQAKTGNTGMITGAIAGASTGGVTGGILGAVKGRVQDWREKREATATLNQKLAIDHKRHGEQVARGKKPQPTPMMQTASSRVKRGANQIWTQADIQAEVAQNRQLRSIGADPRAIVADASEGPEEYQRQVDAVRAVDAHTQHRVTEMQKAYRPLVKDQAAQRGIVGQAGVVVKRIQQRVTSGGAPVSGSDDPEPTPSKLPPPTPNKAPARDKDNQPTLPPPPARAPAPDREQMPTLEPVPVPAVVVAQPEPIALEMPTPAPEPARVYRTDANIEEYDAIQQKLAAVFIQQGEAQREEQMVRVIRERHVSQEAPLVTQVPERAARLRGPQMDMVRARAQTAREKASHRLPRGKEKK